MHPVKQKLLILNVLGGIAVLGSYVHGIVTHPETRGLVWGEIPDGLRPLYTVNMFLAAAGYFLFSYHVFFRVAPETRIAGRYGYSLFSWLYAGILLPSALWLPLTFAMVEAPSGGLWLAIRLVLSITGLCSFALLAAIVATPAPDAVWPKRLAILGLLTFCLQTTVLDALVWPVYFPS